MKKETTLRDFVVFTQLKVGPVEIEPKRIKVPYEIVLVNNEVVGNELIYSYSEKVFETDTYESTNLASVIAAQVAINYGLFCDTIVFDGVYSDADQRLIRDMTENTSREIYVNKLIAPNEFITDEYRGVNVEKFKDYTAAEIQLINSKYSKIVPSRNFAYTNSDEFVILSSGGKDSLLTYGLIKDMGKNAHPVFINESGRHWFTAINAFKYLENNEANTARVWCNSDRIFNWMLRQLPFIRKNFADIRADIYPVRLWTVAVFLFGVLPIARKRKVGNILIGNEYDTTIKLNHRGITHYSGLYDQSKYFDNAMTRYFLKKGWNINQYSILRSLSELLILKILVKKYPELQKQQVSCHAAHEHDGRIYPCGNCEKCRRIIGMIKALEENPEKCGYSEAQIVNGLKALANKTVKQNWCDTAHLYFMLLEKNLIERNEFAIKSAREHQEIMKLRFDNERSNLEDMPSSIRKPLFKILSEYTHDSVKRISKQWVDLKIDDAFLTETRYKFDGQNT